MPTNTNYLFYKKYYEADTPTVLANINAEITSMPIQPIVPVFDGLNANHINLYTTYPGLLIGSGYQHDYKKPDDTKMQEEAFKIGFYFDYTTGMPVIPGSSIKGMLRSCFPQKAVTTKKLSAAFIESRTQFIKDTFKSVLGINEEINVDAIEDEIFHGKRSGKPIPMYQRDVFFQAVPVAIKNTEKKLFYTDYITPHVKENLSYEESMLKNPVPIKFLKVAPNVQYRFEFKLNGSEVCKSLTKDKKLKLFEYLITTLGIGAKTNVGYGQFSETAIKPVIVADNQQQQQNNPRADNRDNRNRPAQRDYRAEVNNPPVVNAITTITSINELKENCSILAKVSSIKSDPIGLTFEFELEGKLFKAETNKYADANNFPVGTAVIIKVKNLEGKKPNFSKITILSVTLSNA